MRKGTVRERTIRRITVAVSVVILGILLAVFLGRIDLTVEGKGAVILSRKAGASARTITDSSFAEAQILVTLPPASFARVKPGQITYIFLKTDEPRPARLTGTVVALTFRMARGGQVPVVRIKPGAEWTEVCSVLSSPAASGQRWQMPVKAKIVVEENKPIYRLLWETAFRRRMRQ